MATLNPPKYIWFNGKTIPWQDAQVHVLSHAIHYGSSVFEGIRCYETSKGPAFFRLREHVERLYLSAKIYRMRIPYSFDELMTACHEVVSSNNLRNAYLRPVAFFGYGSIGVNPSQNPVEVSIASFPWDSYLGNDSIESGVDVCISSWNRVAPNTIPAAAKAGGNYLSSQLIVEEATRKGYVEGIALDVNGYISEGSGENVFVVKNNTLYTPPFTASILPGITRDTVMQLARQMGYQVVEQNMTREALYLADEAFMTGTAAEVVPIKSVDDLAVGSGARGPVTEKLQQAFFGLFKGTTPDDRGWLEMVQGVEDKTYA
ncbi:branched-chain amino acid transaminase [Kangiella taiwanensis]|uniref:Branched-chain-amino-acid aminotransferase n=1 Tax=Kangiella taiwanensis TaxID=1079179 RepID=A0ABP8HVA0_9GAMM|nr:branched-chain amino acid transaminase [Kangiella taiwanensis]